MVSESATYTVRDVARVLGLHPKTIYVMVQQARFPVRPLPLPQRRLLFSRAAVDRLVDAR